MEILFHFSLDFLKIGGILRHKQTLSFITNEHIFQYHCLGTWNYLNTSSHSAYFVFLDLLGFGSGKRLSAGRSPGLPDEVASHVGFNLLGVDHC